MSEQISTIKVALSRSGIDTSKVIVQQRKYNSVFIESELTSSIIGVLKITKCLETAGYLVSFDWELKSFVCSW